MGIMENTITPAIKSTNKKKRTPIIEFVGKGCKNPKMRNPKFGGGKRDLPTTEKLKILFS